MFFDLGRLRQLSGAELFIFRMRVTQRGIVADVSGMGENVATGKFEKIIQFADPVAHGHGLALDSL